MIDYLKLTVGLFGHKRHADGEEVVRLSIHREFHSTSLIVSIYHWQSPFQNILPVVIVVFTITIIDNWSPTASAEL